VLVRQDGPDLWEAAVPAFSVASQGESAEAAVASAFELLDDYLLLCAKEGKDFKDCYRPMWHVGEMLELVRDIAQQSLSHRVRRRFGRLPRPPRRQYFREPLRRSVGGLLAR